MEDEKQKSQSSTNKKSEEVEDAPKLGIEDGENYTLDVQQQSGQPMPPRGLDEQYNLEDFYRKDDEEVAQELAVNDFNQPVTTSEKKDRTTTESQSDSGTGTGAKTGIGWLAVILSVMAFFIMPIVLGAIGIVLGFVSRNRGAQTLGNAAIAAGAIAIVIRLLIVPLV